MPRRSNRVAAAEAQAAHEWAALVQTAVRQVNLHHVKAVCLDEAPTTTNSLKLMCFSSDNTPLAIGSFLCEENLNERFPGFSLDSTTHAVLEIVFEETEGDDHNEGIVLAVKDGLQGITAANLQHLRSQMYE